GGRPSGLDLIQLGQVRAAVDDAGRPIRGEGGLREPLAEHPLPARGVDRRGVDREAKQGGLHQGLVEQQQEDDGREGREIAPVQEGYGKISGCRYGRIDRAAHDQLTTFDINLASPRILDGAVADVANPAPSTAAERVGREGGIEPEPSEVVPVAEW